MKRQHAVNSVDRRSFLGGSALTMLGMTGGALAQEPKAKAAAKMSVADANKVSQAIAEFVTGFDLKTCPQPVVERTRAAFIDTIGVMLAGSREEPAHLIQEMVKAEASAPAATVVGTPLRASAQLAALANGSASHAMDYDFTFMRAQSIAALIPAILPVAETVGATPQEAVAAFIVGAEVSARVVRIDPDGPLFEGWHSTGMVGVFGAAAACARLMKVPAERIPDVIGIAAALASGINVNYGSMSKPLQCANAARNGVLAATLGKSGFTGNAAAFEGRHGFMQTFARGIKGSLDGFRDFGTRYDLATGRYRFKPYPCAGLTHTLIDATIDLRPQVGGRFNDIKNVHCFVARAAERRAGTGYPATIEAAKFSVGYLVPYTLIYGGPKIAAFTEKALHDDRVKAMQTKVTASVDPDLGAGNDDSPARVRITMTDGQTFEQRKDYGSGSNRNPMTGAQFEAKFFDCAAQTVDAEAAKKILVVLNALPERQSLGDLWPLLRKA